MWAWIFLLQRQEMLNFKVYEDEVSNKIHFELHFWALETL